jgi:iron-sulfur cluster repair protein YtfE (RIC family)
MDILKLIEEDHKKTMKGLDELEETKERDTAARKKTWTMLEQDLLAHMKGEEEILYPALQEEIEDKILEAIEEHQLVKMASSVLDETPASDKRWLAKLKVIKENIEHHVEEEEDEIFEAAKEKISKDKLEEMGKRFEEVKRKTSSRK